MSNDYVVVLGGLNVDIAGLTTGRYREHDSNIGKVSINVGGVGQNIAQNLARLETPTYLITVYGDDNFGEFAAKECQKNNINIDYAKQIKGHGNSIYLYINDDQGDLVSAINDMDITKYLNPEMLSERLDFINGAKLVVLDANLSEETIEWVGQNVTSPLFVDPVSVAKVGRVKGILNKIDTIKPNELESEILTGIKITDVKSGEAAAKVLNDKGVKNVFISLGSKGILASSQGKVELFKPMAKNVVSTNGAGDCTMATISWARFYYGDALDVSEVGLLTQSAAAINVESSESVSPDLNIRNVVKRAQENQNN